MDAISTKWANVAQTDSMYLLICYNGKYVTSARKSVCVCVSVCREREREGLKMTESRWRVYCFFYYSFNIVYWFEIFLNRKLGKSECGIALEWISPSVPRPPSPAPPPSPGRPLGGPHTALNGSSHLEIYLYPERMLEESQSLETRSLFHWIAFPFLGCYSLAMDLNMW